MIRIWQKVLILILISYVSCNKYIDITEYDEETQFNSKLEYQNSKRFIVNIYPKMIDLYEAVFRFSLPDIDLDR